MKPARISRKPLAGSIKKKEAPATQSYFTTSSAATPETLGGRYNQNGNPGGGDDDIEKRATETLQLATALKTRLQNLKAPKGSGSKAELIRQLQDAKAQAEAEARQWKARYERAAQDQHVKVESLEARLGELENENWEWRYKFDDQLDEVQALETKLRNCIPVSDDSEYGMAPITPLEKHQREEIEELRKQVIGLETKLRSVGMGSVTVRQ